jgi:L-lactate permease
VTGLPVAGLSAATGRICAPVSLIIPAYLVGVMGGWKALRGVLAGAAVCGIAFASVQFAVSNFVGPQLTDILSSLAAIVSLVGLLLIWKPEGAAAPPPHHHRAREVAVAWAPYGLLVLFVLLWGLEPVRTRLGLVTVTFPWPALHNAIERVAPVVPKPSPYAALYTFNWLAAAGTACVAAALCSVVPGSPRAQPGNCCSRW